MSDTGSITAMYPLDPTAPTTLTSLPAPIILHILDLLTTPLSASRRRTTLLATSIVAPAFVAPSRTLLLREVDFVHRHGRNKLARLLNGGAAGFPAEWRPRRLGFSVLGPEEVATLVDRADSVEELRLEYVQGEVTDGLLGHNALGGLRVLDCGPGVIFAGTATLPPNVASLHLSAPYAPTTTLQSLLSTCQPTLRHFHFLLSSATSLQHLFDALTTSTNPITPHLTSLSIVNCWLFDGDAIPGPLSRLVASCTSLRHLRLEGFSVLQLAPVLRKVVTKLETVTFEDMCGDGSRGIKRAGIELGARLRECSKAQPMRGAKEWRLHVPELVSGEWKWKEDWIECQAVCQVRGTKIIWIK